MGDVVHQFEMWSAAGIAGILAHYPLLNVVMTLWLLRVALKVGFDRESIENKVQFSTDSKARNGLDSKGRRFANAFSLQTVDKWIRKRVVPEGSFEIDIANCYPSILLGVCKNKTKTPWLMSYVVNRKSCLQEIGGNLGIKHDLAKDLILVVLNKGSWRFHLASKKGVDMRSLPGCPYLDGLQAEVNSIRKFVMQTEEYKQIEKKVRKERLKLHEARYETLSFSIFLEQKERAILDTVITASASHFGFNVSSLLHDGFIVSGSTLHQGIIKNGSKQFEVGFVESVLSGKCTEDFGFDIQVKVRLLFFVCI